MNSLRIVVLIPARYGSSRFPGKPLAEIAGRPMVEHVYRRASRCAEAGEAWVATDDARIFHCVQGFGGRAIMTRSDHASGTDRTAEAARFLEVGERDIVVNVQGDQPSFHPSVITRLLEPLHEDPELPMATLMCRFKDRRDELNPNQVKVVTDNRGCALYFSRHPIPYHRDEAQDLGNSRFKHLGFYAYRGWFLQAFTKLPTGRLEAAEMLEQLRALENGYRIGVSQVEEDLPEVDTPEDISRVEAFMAAGPSS
ncbi:MAG: 3-deoxy-manno-octulosonate cytidylyltransferase [Desulfobacteraceae bacterium]